MKPSPNKTKTKTKIPADPCRVLQDFFQPLAASLNLQMQAQGLQLCKW
jgi:hypothetical protein